MSLLSLPVERKAQYYVSLHLSIFTYLGTIIIPWKSFSDIKLIAIYMNYSKLNEILCRLDFSACSIFSQNFAIKSQPQKIQSQKKNLYCVKVSTCRAPVLF